MSDGISDGHEYNNGASVTGKSPRQQESTPKCPHTRFIRRDGYDAPICDDCGAPAPGDWSAPIPKDLQGTDSLTLVKRIIDLTAELTSIKDGKGWWEVTPAGQKKRYSVNEEEELRLACEEITTLEAARDDADGKYLACYKELTRVQAEGTEWAGIAGTHAGEIEVLKAEIEPFFSLIAKYQCNPTGQLSIFEAIRNQLETTHRLCNDNYDWAKRIEAELARLQWQPITPDNLPKVGDELFGGKGQRLMRMPEGYAPMIPMVEDFTLAGWTHFRPINPPDQPATSTESEFKS